MRGILELTFASIVLLMNSPLCSQCYSTPSSHISLFSPFLNNNPRFKKKIPTENFGDSSRKTTKTCNGRGIIHTGNGYYLEFNEPVFAPISGTVHIYTLGSTEVNSNTRTGLWIDGKSMTTNFQGIQPVVADGQYVFRGQVIGKGFDNHGEAGVYFTIRLAPHQNPTTKRSFLPMVENSVTPCKCNNEPVFPEYFINPEVREIDYNDYNEILPEGEVSVHIEPSGVGQWSFDNGETWHNSGTVLRGMPYTYYRIIFRNEYGFRSPLPIDYTLTNTKSVIRLEANYIPDYTILPKPKAEVEKELLESKLGQKIESTRDSIQAVVVSTVNNVLKDTLQVIQLDTRKLLLDSLKGQYDKIAAIQKRQLAIRQVFQYLLPIILLLLVALGIYYSQYRRIRKQKKALELMQTEQHHRVYNNLGIIAGLVIDYGKEIGEEKINDLRNSILAIAKVHSQLYKGESLETVNLNNLFTDIGNALVVQLGSSGNTNYHVNCHVAISQVKATKLALIINEFITNSIKYAIKEPDSPLELQVNGYKKDNSSEIIIQYRDNGPGYNKIPARNNYGSGTGMVLCFGLAKDLGADMRFYNDNGACCIIKLR